MKYILTLLLLITMNLSAQQIVIPVENALDSNSPTTNVYYKDVNNVLDKFTGEWVYNVSPYYLKLEITKVTLKQSPTDAGEFYDELEVRFLLKINGVEKYNTIATDPPVWVTQGHAFMTNDIKKIRLDHSEPSIISCWRGKWAELDLQYIASTSLGAPANLSWSYEYLLKNNEGTCDNGQPYDLTDYLIPNNIILVKQQ